MNQINFLDDDKLNNNDTLNLGDIECAFSIINLYLNECSIEEVHYIYKNKGNEIILILLFKYPNSTVLKNTFIQINKRYFQYLFSIVNIDINIDIILLKINEIFNKTIFKINELRIYYKFDNLSRLILNYSFGLFKESFPELFIKLKKILINKTMSGIRKKRKNRFGMENRPQNAKRVHYEK